MEHGASYYISELGSGASARTLRRFLQVRQTLFGWPHFRLLARPRLGYGERPVTTSMTTPPMADAVGTPQAQAGLQKLRALLLGAGSLGRAFLRRLRDRGGPVDIVGVVTAHHGRMLAPEGIDPSMALNLVES